MNSIRWFEATAALLLGMTLASDFTVGSDGKSFVEKVRRDAPKAWAEYGKSFESNTRFQRRISTIDRSTGKKASEISFKLEIGPRNIMSWQEDWSQETAHVEIVNEHYAFEVQKTQKRPEWRVAAVQILGAKQAWEAYKADRRRDHATSVIQFLPFWVERTWLPKAFSEDAFEIIRAEELKGLEGGRVRVDFRYNRRPKNARFPRSGWFGLDPQQFWRVCEFELTVVHPTSAKDAVEIRGFVECEMVGQMPTLKRIRRTAKGMEFGRAFQTESVYDFVIDQKESNSTAFRLSAFGLPEPVGVEWPSPVRWWLWLSLGAVAALAVALALAKLKARAQPAVG